MLTIIKRHTLSVLVENTAGVLSQVSRLFSRKGYNIESLAVGTTDDPAVSRITIEVLCGEQQVSQIINQLRKQFSVYSVRLLPPEQSIRRELVENHQLRAVISMPSGVFKPYAGVSTAVLVFTKTGAGGTGNVEKLLAEFGILELVRTGMVALERGEATIRNNSGNKVRDEFDLGKNIL